MILFQSIRSKFFFSQFFLLLLTILVVSSTSYRFMANSLLSSQEKQLLQFAGQFANHIHNNLENLQKQLQHIAESRELEMYSQNLQVPIVKEYFVNNFAPFAKLAYLNKEGREEIKVLNGELSTAYKDLSETAIIKQVQANPNRIFFSTPYFCREVAGPVLQAAILQQGYFHDEFIGIIAGTIPLAWLKQELLDPSIGKSGFFRLIGQDGTVLISPDAKEVLTTLQIEGAENGKLPTQQPGVIKQKINGLEGFVSYFQVPQTDWSILVTLPTREFNDGLQKLKQTIILLSTVFFFVSLLLALYFSYLIARPISQLIKASEKVGKGDFKQKLAITSRDEIGTLAQSFNTMTTELDILRERDIRLTEEKKKTDQKLHRAEKMEAIGMMAGGVAHDLNNILSGVVSYPELLLLQLPKDHELRRPIESIKGSGERAVAVVADLLTVASGIASVKEVASLNTLITTFMKSGELETLRTLHPNITLSTDLSPDTGHICCSPVHIHKLLLNLVTNAFEAITGTGTVAINSKNQLDEQKSDTDGPTELTQHVLLQVTDSGSGISSKDMKQIFEPYYSKKFLGRNGTGLGLAVVWSIVNEHDGQIHVSSKEGSTVFTILLPACFEKQAELQPDFPLDNLQGEGTILVVDDESLQQEIAEKMLHTLGYNVDTVSSGEKAIEYLAEHSVDLVLLDMLMEPGINGKETYQKIIHLHPGQKAIIASGFSKNSDAQDAKDLGVGVFIKKPYSMEELGRAVQQELQR